MNMVMDDWKIMKYACEIYGCHVWYSYFLFYTVVNDIVMINKLWTPYGSASYFWLPIILAINVV